MLYLSFGVFDLLGYSIGCQQHDSASFHFMCSYIFRHFFGQGLKG